MKAKLETTIDAYKWVDESGRELLIDYDWDYPSAAEAFGWAPCHSSTDGTIKCPECGKTADEMIAEAADILWAHQGEWAEIDELYQPYFS